MIVLGTADTDLPWVDGAGYLGRDPAAPGLLFPTTQAPELHPSLLERAFSEKARGPGGTIAVLLDPPSLVPLAKALPLSKKKLEEFLAEAEK